MSKKFDSREFNLANISFIPTDFDPRTGVGLPANKGDIAFHDKGQITDIYIKERATKKEWRLITSIPTPSSDTRIIDVITEMFTSSSLLSNLWKTTINETIDNGGFIPTDSNSFQYFSVQGNNGAVVLDVKPFGSFSFIDGTIVRVVGKSDANTITINPNSISGGFKGDDPIVISNNQAYTFQYDSSLDGWILVSSNVVSNSNSPQIDYYEHIQSTLSSVWVINHNLGREPSVSLTDNNGGQFHAIINHINDNQLTVTLDIQGQGKAYLI